MLIETAEGVLNTDHIISAQSTPRTGDQRSTVLFTDGMERSVGVGLHQLEQACGVIVPAVSGFTVVSAMLPGSGETEILYSEQAVLAFRIGHSGTPDGPMPITLAGEPTTLGRVRWTVQQPSGRCCGPDGDHDTVDAFKADCECEAAALARSAA